jgi:hypothetical protein
MAKIFDKKIKVKINKDDQTVSLSVRITDDLVNVFRTTINEFNVMVAEYQSELYNIPVQEEIPSTEETTSTDETPII